MAKLVFFDIDGTLFRRDILVPESAARAIKAFVAQGNYVMLCTGRNHSMIPGEVYELPICGEVEGCGTYVSVGEKVLVDAGIEGDVCKEVLAILRDCKCPCYIENPDYFYYDTEYVPPVFQQAAVVMNTKYPGKQKTIAEFPYRMSKITGYPEDRSRLQELSERLSPWFDVIIHEEYDYIEITLKGYSKGTGVKLAAEYLGVAYEDTYAFGDSMNDLTMLQAVAHPIVMGDATAELKEMFPATTSIYNDGIYNGMKMLGLI